MSEVNPQSSDCGKVGVPEQCIGMEMAGVMMELLEAQDTGYLPASMGVFTILTTDALNVSFSYFRVQTWNTS